MVSAPLTVASSVLLSTGEDVKPMDLESTESSAFTRRVGGPFAPRGRLLQDVPQNPGSSPGNSVAQQMHHLMVSISVEYHLDIPHVRTLHGYRGNNIGCIDGPVE